MLSKMRGIGGVLAFAGESWGRGRREVEGFRMAHLPAGGKGCVSCFHHTAWGEDGPGAGGLRGKRGEG